MLFNCFVCTKPVTYSELPVALDAPSVPSARCTLSKVNATCAAVNRQANDLPKTGTSKRKQILALAGVAQWVECQPVK